MASNSKPILFSVIYHLGVGQAPLHGEQTAALTHTGDTQMNNAAFKAGDKVQAGIDDLQRDVNRMTRRRALCLKVERLPLKVSGIGKNQWGLFYRVWRSNAFYAGKVIADLPYSQRLTYWNAISRLDRSSACNVDWLALRAAAVDAGIDRTVALRGTL